MTPIRIARSDEEILGCFPVMRQLRPHLEEGSFVERIRLQEREGYRLVLLDEEGAIHAVAGFRLLTNLLNGRILYVDDLVTDAECRSRGRGERLLNWLADHGRASGCKTLELDSGVQRFDAHRFYMTNRMAISSYHFRHEL